MKIRHAPSGLSLAIRKIMDSYQNDQPLVEKAALTQFTIKIANTLEERQAAFALGYQVYLAKGFISPNPHEMLIHPYDSNDETVILIVLDKQKNIAGSVTIVFDVNSRLPAEKKLPRRIKSLKRCWY